MAAWWATSRTGGCCGDWGRCLLLSDACCSVPPALITLSAHLTTFSLTTPCSNLIPRPGTCISSAPSSPSCSTLLPDAAAGFQTTSYSAAGEGMSPPPPRLKAAPAVPPPSDSGDFAEFASDPCKGFSDIDNVVPGGWGWTGRQDKECQLLMQGQQFCWGFVRRFTCMECCHTRSSPPTHLPLSIPQLRAGYVLGPVLGKGGFCSVRKALHELTGQAVACKIIEKGKLKVRCGGGWDGGGWTGVGWMHTPPFQCGGWSPLAAVFRAAQFPCLHAPPAHPPTPPQYHHTVHQPQPKQDPKDRDRVDRECRVMRNLSNHVAVVKLYEYVETRDYVYIMMEAARRGWVGVGGWLGGCGRWLSCGGRVM